MKKNMNFIQSILIVTAILIWAGCGSNVPSNTESNVISGTVTFNYNGTPISDASKWPNTTDTSRLVTGRIKIAFVPIDPVSLQARVNPTAAIPGLGEIGGIEFSALRNGRLEFSSAQSRDGSNNIVGSLPKDIYGVFVTYVNPFFTGQSAQQFLNTPANTPSAIADLRSNSSVTVTDVVEMKVIETLMIAGRAGTASLSGTVTASTNAANWPAAPVGPPNAWAQGAEFIAILGFRDGTPPGVPGVFLVLPKPATGNATTFATNIPLGTYRNITIARYKVDSSAPGGFRTLTTLAQFSNPQTQQNVMTMDAGNRQAVWNVSIAL